MSWIRRFLRRLDVGEGKIGALEQERFARGLCERVGEAIAKVQARLVASLPEVEKGLAGMLAMIHRHRLDHDARRDERRFQSGACPRVRAGFRSPWTVRRNSQR